MQNHRSAWNFSNFTLGIIMAWLGLRCNESWPLLATVAVELCNHLFRAGLYHIHSLKTLHRIFSESFECFSVIRTIRKAVVTLFKLLEIYVKNKRQFGRCNVNWKFAFAILSFNIQSHFYKISG